MNTNEHAWYRVPEVLLIVVLLGSTIAGSLALVATAVRHGAALQTAVPRAIASPLPPSAARPAADATP